MRGSEPAGFPAATSGSPSGASLLSLLGGGTSGGVQASPLVSVPPPSAPSAGTPAACGAMLLSQLRDQSSAGLGPFKILLNLPHSLPSSKTCAAITAVGLAADPYDVHDHQSHPQSLVLACVRDRVVGSHSRGSLVNRHGVPLHLLPLHRGPGRVICRL